MRLCPQTLPMLLPSRRPLSTRSLRIIQGGRKRALLSRRMKSRYIAARDGSGAVNILTAWFESKSDGLISAPPTELHDLQIGDLFLHRTANPGRYQLWLRVTDGRGKHAWKEVDVGYEGQHGMVLSLTAGKLEPSWKSRRALRQGTRAKAPSLPGCPAGVSVEIWVGSPSRLQAQQHSLADPLEAPRYRNAGHAVYAIVREEGVRALYRGVSLTALRQATNQGANFTAYQELKKLAHRWQPDREELPSWQHMAIGLVSGAMGPFSNAPIDTIKTRTFPPSCLCFV
ncbi:hypothetical protein NUW54_g14238 [Trametes sanguinea]|uniref:Uncharacterized protein n=1 Tax=Trametes sanguinea TaxID=158606 RepID=A0ACC1ME47_9APHY|nr:hypothetical protein NUW54_g14238 [Trametes sanguinea]